MNPEFWLERWRQGRTGFHQSQVMSLLQKHWPVLGIAAGERILVPLCGKSLDMLWLAAQGYRVLGVELSPLAVEQFFSEQGLHPQVHTSPQGKHYIAGNIEVTCGDIFNLDKQTLSTCMGVYDRAALIALPPSMRKAYVQHIYPALPAASTGLLITLDYPQEQMDGPPFSVDDQEVQALFSAHTQADILERRDILNEEGKFQSSGVQRVDTLVYQLTPITRTARGQP